MIKFLYLYYWGNYQVRVPKLALTSKKARAVNKSRTAKQAQRPRPRGHTRHGAKRNGRRSLLEVHSVLRR
jgi:hypothetical protein